MTKAQYTQSDTELLHALHARQLRESLPPAELALTNVLEGREAARKLCEAVYSGMGADNAIYDALEPVRDGLALASHGTAADRVAGYTMGLRAMLDEPDAFMAAVRVLVTKLETDHE